jgi:hypothetical protein
MEEAQSRADKLRLLKERAQAKRERDEAGGDADGSAEDGPKLKFRNYKVGIVCNHMTTKILHFEMPFYLLLRRTQHVAASCMDRFI